MCVQYKVSTMICEAVNPSKENDQIAAGYSDLIFDVHMLGAYMYQI